MAQKGMPVLQTQGSRVILCLLIIGESKIGSIVSYDKIVDFSRFLWDISVLFSHGQCSENEINWRTSTIGSWRPMRNCFVCLSIFNRSYNNKQYEKKKKEISYVNDELTSYVWHPLWFLMTYSRIYPTKNKPLHYPLEMKNQSHEFWTNRWFPHWKLFRTIKIRM